MLQLQANLALNRSIQQPLPRVIDGQLELRRPIAFLAQDVTVNDCRGPFRRDFDEEVEHVFVFAAADGQHAMRGNRLHRLGVLVVHLEFFLLIDRVGDFFADHHALVEEHLAQRLAQVGVFADPLGDNVARAFQRLVRRGHAQLRIHEGGGKSLQWQIGFFLCPQVRGQRFQTLFARDGGLGAPLGLVGQIEVFQLALVERGLDARLQLIGQLALFGDGGQNGLAPVGQLAEVGQIFLNCENLHLVQIAGGLLAVARDERHRAATVEQLDYGDQPAQRHVQRLCDVKKKFRGEIFCVRHKCPMFIVHGSREGAERLKNVQKRA